ncbi:MAG: hypothetical protein M3383_04570 [Actinomycetota bacterium]|nr:hypothetical protein [Actinomycetota bacterium]
MPERIIDVPLESLPFIDEHFIEIAARPETVWKAMVEEVAEAGARATWRRGAKRLGCVHTELGGEPGQTGWRVPGFVATRAVEPAVLALMGRHRYATYALILTVLEKPSGLILLGAQTRAEFIGARGKAYRHAVIGTRGHLILMKGLLRRARKRAERARARPPAGDLLVKSQD